MIIRLVDLHVRPDRQAELAAVLADSSPRVRAMPGCTGLYILQDVDNPHHYLTWSAWESEAALEAYRASPLFEDVWPRIRACLAGRAAARTFAVHPPT